MYKRSSVFAFIPARGGSKRVKRKNMREVGGKPLIFYSIQAAQESKYLDKVIVSTEDEEVAQYALSVGCEVLGRTEEQCEDGYSTDMLRNDFYRQFEYDYIITLHPTSPFRTSEDIDKGIEMIVNSGADSLLSVARIWHLPWQAMYIEDGYLKHTFGEKWRFMQSQELPEAYENAHFLTIWKWGKNAGKEIPYVISGMKTVDIDEEKDLEFANYLMASTSGRKDEQ